MDNSAQIPPAVLSPPPQAGQQTTIPAQPINPPPPKDATNNLGKKILISLVFFVILTVLVSAVLFLSKGKTGSASISGNIDINGSVPSKSTIAIAVRKAGDGQFDIVADGIVPSDQTGWYWKGAQKGALYEVKAYVRNNGNIIDESKTIIVAAPAFNETLRINSKSTPPAPKKTSISGIIDFNGFVPNESTISIAARKAGEGQFDTAVKGVTAIDGAKWSWNDAEEGSQYELKALLLVKEGTTLIESTVLTVSAPAANEELRIQSPLVTPTISPTPQFESNANLSPTVLPTATPASFASPTPSSVTISGIIDLNGHVPSNAEITIAERKKGESQFNIVSYGLKAQDEVSWSWNDANVGIAYELKAYLRVRGVNVSESQTKVIVAPAGNEILTINAGSNLSQSQNSPGVDCQQANSSNNWNVKISYHSIDGAKQYWIKAGDINQDNRFIDTRIPPNNQTLPTTYSFTTDYFFSQGVTYYVKYAYSTCDTCTDSFYFSPFSAITQFSCNPPGPTNTPTPTRTPAPTNTPLPTSTPTLTPIPTDTPTPTNIPSPTPPPIPTN